MNLSYLIPFKFLKAIGIIIMSQININYSNFTTHIIYLKIYLY